MKKTIISLILAAIIYPSCTDKKESLQFEGNWIEIMPKGLNYVQGFTLEDEGKAKSIGMATLLYNKWELYNNNLILCGQSIGNGQTIDFCDTLLIVKATSDSLILQTKSTNQFKYYKVPDIVDGVPFNVLDSLHNDGKSENYETKNFKGNINNHSCIEIKSNLTIYKYKNEDEGVYKLVNTYIRGNDENPEKNEFGRIYILKGDAKDANAKVYQLVPFDEGEIQNFLYTDKKLILLNSKFELPANKEDYQYLKRQ